MEKLTTFLAVTLLLTAQVVSAFVPVTGIINYPTTATVGVPLTLTAVVEPHDATNQTIMWSVITFGGIATITDGNIFTATGNYYVTVRATITDGKAVGEDYTYDVQISVFPHDLSGTVTIMGLAQVGETLTANISGLVIAPSVIDFDFGSLEYLWLRDNVLIPDATGSSYTLTADDIGRSISVEVWSTEIEGTVSS